MALVCADCRTANRDGAKFCKGCGHRLNAVAAPVEAAANDSSDDWPATQRMPMRPDLAMPAPRTSRPTAERARAKPLPGSLSDPIPHAAERKSLPPVSPAPGSAGLRRVAFGLLAAVVLAVGGGWYLESDRSRPAATPTATLSGPATVAAPPTEAAPEPAAATAAATVEPVAPNPVPAPAPAAVVQPSEPSAPPQEAVAQVELPATPLPPAVPAKPAAAPSKPRKPAAAPTPPPLAALPAVPTAAPPAPEPPAPASPQAVCAELNFFARAQCMAAQCAKADFKAHPQCEAVRRQQQIDEEKRNPPLLN